MNQTQQPRLVNNVLFCYGNEHTGNENERKQHFLQHKGKHSSSKEAYTDGSKNTGRKVGNIPSRSKKQRRLHSYCKKAIAHKRLDIRTTLQVVALEV